MSRVWVQRHARSLGLLAFAALSFAWFARAWADPFHRHAGVLGDPDNYLFALAWPPFAVTHHMNPFATPYLLAPRGANLMWSIPPGFGLILWPLTATAGVVFTYNVLATLSLAASAWTAQLALRRFVPGELGPFVGGLFYGFSPYMGAHSLAHVMLTVAILPPLLLLLLHEMFVRQRWRPALTGLAIGALVVFQLSTFLELLAGGAVATVVLTIVLAVAYRHEIRARARYVGIAVVTAGVSILVLGAPQLWTLFFGAGNLVHVTALLHPQNAAITDIYGFVLPSQFNLVAPSFVRGISNHFSAGGAEANGYIGVPVLIICVVIVVTHWRSATVRIASIMTLVMALFSMGPRFQIEGRSTIPLPWALIEKLPLMGNLLPVRLSVFTDLGIALLLAYGIGHWVRPASWKRKVVRVVAASAAVLTLLPSFYLLRVIWAPVDIPPYFTSSRVKQIPEGSIALVAPWTTDTGNVAPEVWQVYADFRFKLSSGYAYTPVGHGGVTSGLTVDPLEGAMYRINLGIAPDLTKARTRNVLRRLVLQHQIETVIVGPMPYQHTMLRFITDLLQRAPEHTGGVYVWRHVGDSKVLDSVRASAGSAP